MTAPTASTALRKAVQQLHEHAGVPLDGRSHVSSSSKNPVALASVGRHRFVLTYATSGAVAPVTRAIERLDTEPDEGVALIVVPFMGDAGARMCDAAGIDWLDLSGPDGANACP